MKAPWRVLYRAKWEGGEWEGDEVTRQDLLRTAIDLGAEYVDVELKVFFFVLCLCSGVRSNSELKLRLASTSRFQVLFIWLTILPSLHLLICYMEVWQQLSAGIYSYRFPRIEPIIILISSVRSSWVVGSSGLLESHAYWSIMIHLLVSELV